MRKLTSRIALSAALSAAVLLGAAAPSHAQANPIVTGEGEVVAPMAGPLGIELSLIELPSGRLNGHGTQVFHATGGWVEFELTSYMFIDETLCMAGPVTAAFNAPSSYSVGATIVFCVQDNGHGGASSPDKMAGSVGPPNLTIQQIIALIGPPPPQAFQPLTDGNFKIH